MKKIQRYVEMINEEIEGAKCYAEKYVEYKSMGDSTWANRFKEMSNDELKHANYIHDLAVQNINQINQIFQPTVEMQEVWDKSHKEYVDKTAWVRQMLAM